MDGNTIQLRISLVSQAGPVDFYLRGLPAPVASCAVKSGEKSCATSPFSASGWYWNPDGVAQPNRVLSASSSGETLKGELSVEVRPRPVVMAHGFASSWETWGKYLGPQGFLASLGLQGFAVGDGQAPGVMNTGSFENLPERTNSIGQNAAILGEYIKGVQAKTGAEKVDLVVHSMGGMISRFYIDRIMPNQDVAQIIFLGTPQAGSACVAPVAALGFALPASLEIQPAYMEKIFNQQIFRRHGVPFYAVAGTRLIEVVSSPCAQIPSDMVVALGSANAIPLGDVQKIPLIHSDLTENTDVFENYVKKHLQTPPGGFPFEADPAPGSVAQIPMQFTKIYTGHLAPGESKDITIQIDPNVGVASFGLFDSSHSLNIVVRGASGKEITLDEKTGFMQVSDPTLLLYLGYGFNNPKPGAWLVTLQTTALTPAEGSDYALHAQFVGGATLEATTNVTIPAPDEPVILQARLKTAGQAAAIDIVEAILRKPDGSTETVQLAPNGDVYSLTYLPKMTGIYGAEVNVTGKTADGLLIDRAAFLTFEVQPRKAEIQDARWSIALITALAILLALVIVIMLRRRKH